MLLGQLREVVCNMWVVANQMAFLQYVLHAPINNENKKDFLRAIKSLHMIKFNPLILYLVLIDRQIDSKLAKVYLDFQSTLAWVCFQKDSL